MEQTCLEIGTIVNTHGVRGELKLLPVDGVDAALLTGCRAFLIDGQAIVPRSVRVHKGCLLFRLDGVTDMDAALPYKGRTVSARRDDLHLPEGVYLPAELAGMQVLDAETGEELGRLARVLSYPSQDVYLVRGRQEFLVPAVPAFIAEIDLPGNTMKIHVWEGLIDAD